MTNTAITARPTVTEAQLLRLAMCFWNLLGLIGCTYEAGVTK